MTEGLRVLFLCTGNSARSQMAEAILRHLSRGAVEAASAGSRPAAEVHPLAIDALRDLFGLEASGCRPKGLGELPPEPFDYVITLCDSAAESCPVFPGAGRVHWSLADPARVEGTLEERRRAFRSMALELRTRIGLLLASAPFARRISSAV